MAGAGCWSADPVVGSGLDGAEGAAGPALGESGVPASRWFRSEDVAPEDEEPPVALVADWQSRAVLALAQSPAGGSAWKTVGSARAVAGVATSASIAMPAVSAERRIRARPSRGEFTGAAAGGGVEVLEQSRSGVDADRCDAAFVVAQHRQALAVGEEALDEAVVVAVEA